MVRWRLNNRVRAAGRVSAHSVPHGASGIGKLLCLCRRRDHAEGNLPILDSSDRKPAIESRQPPLAGFGQPEEVSVRHLCSSQDPLRIDSGGGDKAYIVVPEGVAGKLRQLGNDPGNYGR